MKLASGLENQTQYQLSHSRRSVGDNPSQSGHNGGQSLHLRHNSQDNSTPFSNAPQQAQTGPADGRTDYFAMGDTEAAYSNLMTSTRGFGSATARTKKKAIAEVDTQKSPATGEPERKEQMYETSLQVSSSNNNNNHIHLQQKASTTTTTIGRRQHQNRGTNLEAALSQGRAEWNTTQPALLPFDKRDFHDSNCLSNNTSPPVGTRLGGAAIAVFHIAHTLNAEGSSTKETLESSGVAVIGCQKDEESVDRQQIMGYSNHGTPWRAQDSSHMTSKMESTQQQQEPEEHPFGHERKERDDDSTTARSVDTASIGSPILGPFIAASSNDHAFNGGLQSTATTPSTASTAPSTIDELSLGAFDSSALERLVLRGETLDPGALYAAQHPHHNPHHLPRLLGGPPWDTNNNPPYQAQLYVQDETDHGAFQSRAVMSPPYHGQQQQHWGNVHHSSNQRIASFRNEQQQQPHGGFVANAWHQQQQHHHQHRHPPPSPQQQQPARGTESRAFAVPAATNFGPYHRPQSGAPQATPPRNTSVRTPARPSPHTASPAGQSSSQGTSNPRSPSEVLKTLLRKKACLYEPDTSRAVALATWLVGRELALELGYFSRQQLQAGVHACVARKIDSGVITRTKVNRCMQIILNSCFHYIIPRPDGTEENGDAFRRVFADEATNDMELLRQLPAPWNDLNVDRDNVLEAAFTDVAADSTKLPSAPNSAPSTPQTSPRLSSTQVDKGSPKANKDEDSDGKRAVLLCFNENVRCAEDVFRCHNEFIRDTAHASGLQLSSNEWRSFFGKEAASSPYLWGNVGIPVPRAEGSRQVDALGVMTHSELSKFRTFWCSKRYDHDHELCGFAHVEVNGGWLRRNTERHRYGMEMCPDISRVSLARGPGNKKYIINACPRGVNCCYAHSVEEILYHPQRYKSGLCSRSSGCPNGDVCPDFHPAETYKFPSKKGEGRLNSRQPRQGANSQKGGPAQPPAPAPILFCSPAPVSRFEEHFQMPGLKNLYRRHCSVMRAYLRNPGSCLCCYSCFGDDTGTGIDPSSLASFKKKRGLPQPRGV